MCDYILRHKYTPRLKFHIIINKSEANPSALKMHCTNDDSLAKLKRCTRFLYVQNGLNDTVDIVQQNGNESARLQHQQFVSVGFETWYLSLCLSQKSMLFTCMCKFHSVDIRWHNYNAQLVQHTKCIHHIVLRCALHNSCIQCGTCTLEIQLHSKFIEQTAQCFLQFHCRRFVKNNDQCARGKTNCQCGISTIFHSLESKWKFGHNAHALKSNFPFNKSYGRHRDADLYWAQTICNGQNAAQQHLTTDTIHKFNEAIFNFDFNVLSILMAKFLKIECSRANVKILIHKLFWEIHIGIELFPKLLLLYKIQHIKLDKKCFIQIANVNDDTIRCQLP